MANAVVEMKLPSGMASLTLKLFPHGSDTIANGAGDSLVEESARKGIYLATVTEGLTGNHHAIAFSGSTPVAAYDVYLTDTTAVHRCFDYFPPTQQVNTVSWAGTTIVATSIPVGTAAGAANGLLISGSNSGTTTLGALTVTGSVNAGAINTVGDVNINGALGINLSLSVGGVTEFTGAITATHANNNLRLGTFTVTTNAIAWNAAWDAEVQSEAADALTAYGAATSTEVTSIQNNTRVVRVVPDDIELPTAGTRTYRIELLLYDSTGNMEAPDSAPTITLVNQAGTDRSARLDSTTMALVSAGRYRAVYTSTAGDTKEQLVWSFSVVEGGATRLYGNTSYITDAIATDFTTSDRTKLDTLHDTRIPGVIQPQTGDAFARLGAPTGASVSADIADLPTNAELATSQAAADDATLAAIAALSIPTAAQVFTSVLTTQMTESYAADGVAPTLAQAAFAIQQGLLEFAIASTTITTKKINKSTTAMTHTLDSAVTPTSRTRAT